MLAEVECLRTIDRLLLRGRLDAPGAAARRASIFDLLQRIALVEITRPILSRASDPFPTPLGTLDAIHLATALSWRDRNQPDLVLATHDAALAMAARACGLQAVGVS